MRKKVAVLLPWLKMGGTNKVALRFINELIDYCDVTLILSQNTGELFDEIPNGVEVIIDEMRDFKDIFKEDLKKLRIFNIMKDIAYYSKIKMGKDSIDNWKYMVDRHSYITETEFDCAISYHGQSPERLLNLLYRIRSKKKIAWIHGEMSFSQSMCDRMKKYYEQMDYLFFVSNPTKESFNKVIPFDVSKEIVYYNPLDKKNILELAEEQMDIVMPSSSLNILTVGRISSEKGQNMIPGIVKHLLADGYSVNWYMVGNGPDEEKIADLVENANMQHNIHMLGVKNNPYSYMKNCDIYVQPSYTEGYSTTICEAGILGKAIVGTKPSGGIRDQITDGEDGLIVDATVDGIYDGIKKLIEKPLLKEEFETKILEKNFEGKGEINKFLRVLNNETA